MVRDLSVSTLHTSNSKIRHTPPFRRIPKWEKGLWGLFFAMGVMAVPSWVLYHLPDYRGGLGPHVSYLRQQRREAEKNESS